MLFAGTVAAAPTLQIESSEGKDGIAGEIHATVRQPFGLAAAALREPAHWCEILMLHLDTKECHVLTVGGNTIVNVGVVSKYDQPASSAYRVSFGYHRHEDTACSLQESMLCAGTGEMIAAHHFRTASTSIGLR